MPTGFTQHIADGTETTLRQYALRCARGMGALFTMRDDPSDAPVPEQLPYVPGYHDELLQQGTARLAELGVMTKEQIKAAAKQWNAENETSRQDAVDKNDAQRARYDRLIAETSQWQNAPEGLKEFMLSQLEQSREFDCPQDPLKYHPTAQTADEWFKSERTKALRDIQYGAEHSDKDRERLAERNAWLAQLHTALKGLPQ